MRFKIPFTLSSTERLKKRKIKFKFILKSKNEKLKNYLENADAGIDPKQYLNICYRGLISSFIAYSIIFTTIFFLFKINLFYIYSLLLSALLSGFIFITRLYYPKIFFMRKQREIEKNLLPALEDISVQLSSGIPLYQIMVNVSASEYGELGKQFKKIVRKINAGVPETEVLDEIGEKNPSQFFRRTLWQISNGMKSGGDISLVIRDSIKILNGEQVIQIQNYGNKLNPLIMFYMLITVILPALAITFLTIVSSMVNLGETKTIFMYIGMFVIVVLIQTMFLGAIRSSRPSLL